MAMTININIGGVNGFGNGQQDITSMSNNELKDKVKDTNASPQDRLAALLELIKRAIEEIKNKEKENPGSSGDDQKDLQNALKKLLNGQKLNDSEVSKLGNALMSALGIDSTATQALQDLAGGGSDSGGVR